MTRFLYQLLCIGLLLSAFSACSIKTPIVEKESIKAQAIEAFHGRLIVREPNRRWQVLIQWQANLNNGHTRLTHAATGRIIELQWQGDDIQVRDNLQKTPKWRYISAETLMKYGIVVPPKTLAAILHQQIPPSLQQKDAQTWQGRLHGNLIRLQWQHDGHTLTLTDISHGRTAILSIQP